MISSTSPSARRRVRITAAAVAALAATALTTMLVAPSAVAAAPARVERTTQTCSGVTVVVDFRSLGGGTQSRCAAGDPSDGFKALQGAGIGYRTVTTSPGFLCQISGTPASNCGRVPPANAYWSYWYKDPGSGWVYSDKGAGNRDPQPGGTEGWSYYAAACDGASAKPPGSSSRPNCPPPPTSPPPIAAPTTRAPAPAPAPPPTTRAPATTKAPPTTRAPIATRPPGSGSAGGSGPDASPGSTPAAGGPAASTAPAEGTPVTEPDGTVVTQPDGSPVTTPGRSPVTTPGRSTPGADGAVTDGSADSTTEPDAAGDQTLGEQAIAAREGTRDLAGPEKESGSPVPAVAAVLVVAALCGFGVFTARRRADAG